MSSTSPPRKFRLAPAAFASRQITPATLSDAAHAKLVCVSVQVVTVIWPAVPCTASAAAATVVKAASGSTPSATPELCRISQMTLFVVTEAEYQITVNVTVPPAVMSGGARNVNVRHSSVDWSKSTGSISTFVPASFANGGMESAASNGNNALIGQSSSLSALVSDPDPTVVRVAPLPMRSASESASQQTCPSAVPPAQVEACWGRINPSVVVEESFPEKFNKSVAPATMLAQSPDAQLKTSGMSPAPAATQSSTPAPSVERTSLAAPSSDGKV